MRGVVQSVEVVYHAHATEDPEKIRETVMTLIGPTATPEVDQLDGHFGNQITRVRFHLVGGEGQEAYDRLISGLPESFRKELREALDLLLDESSTLYLRLDKQRLVSGEFATGSSDSIRVKVKLKVHALKESPREFYLKSLGGG